MSGRDYIGQKIKIMVEHEIMDETEGSCLGSGDYQGDYVCQYHVFRDRHHGRKMPTEWHKPKCTLFNEWLPDKYVKCEKCIEAVKKAKENGVKSESQWN